MAAPNSVDVAVQSYMKLSKEEKVEFSAVLRGYELAKSTQQNAGKKAAATKRANSAPAASKPAAAGGAE